MSSYLNFMNQEQKQSILYAAKKHTKQVIAVIRESLQNLRQISTKTAKELSSLPAADQIVQGRLLAHRDQRLTELQHLQGSPYFVRCEIDYVDKEKKKILYFGKFSFTDKSVYSWITPAAAVRFEKPGEISYVRPDGQLQKGILRRKDQYMIVDGKIIFLATETIDTPRELIHQEYFSTRKTEFVLPEIVEQMEKAQDQVIRAHHVGPFLISGPAGSGKTTLALHRVAYLVQSPDTTQLYSPKSIIVFVQDTGTKEYFSQLLPELGIRDVSLVTFSEWAMKILDINDVSYIIRYGDTEEEKDEYEYQKLQALKQINNFKYSKNIFTDLEKVYQPFFSAPSHKLFQKQKQELILDRFDLTLLLKAYSNTFGQLDITEEYYIELKNGKLKKKVGKLPLQYSLIIVDEFQNYLPEQLQIFKKCTQKKLQSILYVGDMAQQIQLGTIRDWNEIGESVPDERQAVLQKVYRNTKSILEYIQKLGYNIHIPKEIKEGSPVIEKILPNKTEEIKHIQSIISQEEKVSIGILAKDKEYLDEFEQEFESNQNVRVFTMSEAQGVEFDIVCIVGINEDTLTVKCRDTLPATFCNEKERIIKDLLYVALTRAMNELHILGTVKLESI